MDNQDIPVKITHYINPNRFYCCDLSDTEKILTLSNMETAYKDHCTKLLKPTSEEPNENDIVGYYPPLTGKWIRCTVDGDVRYNSLGERVAILWATDYGKPATTRFLQNLVPLPRENMIKTNPIFHAGLAVLPVCQMLNAHKNRTDLVVQDEWGSEAIYQTCSWIRQASRILFRPSKTIVDDEIAFGELIIHNANGESFEVGRRLCDKGLAVFEDNQERFLNSFNRSTSAIIDRWDNNMRDNRILDVPDTLFVTDIGEPLSDEKAKFRQLYEDPKKHQLQIQEDVDINRSIQKVCEWNHRNEGVIPEIPKELEDIEEVLNGPLKTPERDVPESQDIPLKRIDKVFQPFKESPFANISKTSAASSSRSVVMMPAGAQFNASFKPILVNENLKEIDLESMVRDSTDDSNGDEEQLLPEENPENPKKKNDCCISQKSSAKFVTDEDSVLEKWMEVEVGEEYNVIVSSFGSCKSFYVQVVNDESKWEELEAMLSSLKILVPLETIKVGKLCLVKLKRQLMRGKIIRCSETSAVVFCVDCGTIVYFHNEEIEAYEMPVDVLNIMPFQAVNCCLAGITAPANYSWTGYIYFKIIDQMHEQKIRVIRKLDRNVEMLTSCLNGVSSYDVELFDTKGLIGQTIGDILVKYQLADYEL